MRQIDEGGPPTLRLTGHRAEIRLNRPAVHNRLEPSDVLRLGEMLREVTEAPDLRLVSFHASGPSFCSGFNLKAVGATEGRSQETLDALALFMRLPEMVEALPMPTLFALNGPVYGGGADIVLAGCFRIGTPATALSSAAAGRGALYSPSGMVRAVNLLGVSAAKRVFMAGQTLTAQELLNLGGLDAVVGVDKLAATADRWSVDICSFGPLPLRAAKQIINDAGRGVFDASAAQRLADEVYGSADRAEGMDAYLERRPPRFEGR